MLGVDGIAVAVVCAPGDDLLARLDGTREALTVARASVFESVDAIVKATKTVVDKSFHPLYQAGLASAGAPPEKRRGKAAAPLDLELGLQAVDGKPCLLLTFRADLFSRDTARRLLAQTRRMLCAFAARDASKLAKTRVGDVALDSEAERRATLLAANETKRPWPEKSCIHDLLFAAARKHPTAAALKYDLALTKTTYRALGSAVAVLAERLAALGCLGPDAPVALLLERDPSLVVGVYGALAAGGCYVPLEPDYPLERIKTVVEDAGCSVVVTQQRLVDGPLKALLGEGSVELPAVVQAVVPLKFGADDAGGPDRRPVAATIFERFFGWENNEKSSPSCLVGLDVFGGGDRDDCGAGARAPTTTPGHLVYIFYTSGTTGKPKGVAVEHRGLVRRIAWFDRLYPLKAGRDAMLLKTTYTFGISEWELFWAPTTGATTVVANNEGHRFASYVADIMLAGDVTASVERQECFFA